MGDSHWDELAARWSALGPPLRPPVEASTAILRAIEGHDLRVLVLGVTPELADAGIDVVAVERNAAMIAVVWPGDGPHRRAMLGDWRTVTDESSALAVEPFSAVVGDGALACVGRGELQPLLRDVATLLEPEGVVAVRCYVHPDQPESLEAVQADVLAGRVASVDACKLRLGMALVDERGEVAVESILAAFDELFLEREGLAAMTGWTPLAVAGIEAYRGSPEVYLFPTEAELLAAVPEEYSSAALAPTVGYELAERCPVLVLRRR